MLCLVRNQFTSLNGAALEVEKSQSASRAKKVGLSVPSKAIRSMAPGNNHGSAPILLP